MLTRSMMRLSAALCLWAGSVGAANAQFFFVTDNAGYTGSWTRYATLADAQINANPLSSGAIPQRNLGVYVSNNLTPPGNPVGNASIFTTNWYSSTTAVPGTGNSSNTSLGFFQMYNDPTNGNTVNNSFWDQSLKTLTLNESGGGVPGVPGAESRFSPLAGLGIVETQGNYLQYAFTATASGLTGTPNGGNIEDITSGASNFTGAFNAIFQNTGGNPALEGFYNISLNFNNSSTVGSEGLTFNNTPVDLFASATVLPEPASCLTFAMVFAASAGFGWRKNRQRRANAQASA